jgi:hypothetical protein
MNIIYNLLVFLLLFQDLPLANKFGEYGKSLVGITAFLALMFYIIKYKKIQFNKSLKPFFNLVIYLFIINFVSIVIQYFIYGNSNFLGENLINKGIKISIYYFTNIVYLLVMYLYAKKLPEKKVLWPFYIGYLLLFVIMLVEYMTLPSAFSMLHATRPDAYNRIRLLTSESSYTSTLIWVFYTLAFLYCQKFKDKKSLVLLTILSLIFIYTSTSKTLLLMFLLGMFSLFAINKKIKLKYKIGVFVMTIIVLIFLSNNLFTYFYLAFDGSTTVYTRSYTFIIALIISFIYPFGLGNIFYLPKYVTILKGHLNDAIKLIPNFNSSEISNVIYSGTDKNISAYSGLMQYGMYWGIIGNLYFIKSILKSSKNAIKKYPILYFGFIGIMFAVLSSITFDNKYEIWAFLVILFYYNEMEDNLNEKKTNYTL